MGALGPLVPLCSLNNRNPDGNLVAQPFQADFPARKLPNSAYRDVLNILTTQVGENGVWTMFSMS